MRQIRMVQIVLIGMTVTLGGSVSVLWAADRGDPPGREAYLRYCGACHGAQAKGDGIVSPFMRPTPPDLTTIAQRNGGTFPTEQVERTVDGREMLHAHGTPTMPVWGTILSQKLGSRGIQRPGIERRVLGQILDVVEYLRTIQEK
jgi:cytochrome c